MTSNNFNNYTIYGYYHSRYIYNLNCITGKQPSIPHFWATSAGVQCYLHINHWLFRHFLCIWSSPVCFFSHLLMHCHLLSLGTLLYCHCLDPSLFCELQTIIACACLSGIDICITKCALHWKIQHIICSGKFLLVKSFTKMVPEAIEGIFAVVIFPTHPCIGRYQLHGQLKLSALYCVS